MAPPDRTGHLSELLPRLVDLRRPIARVSNLAIHLNRELATEGLKLNAQQHLQPIFGLGDSREGTFPEWLCERLGVDPAELLSLEVMTHDLTPSAVVGSSGEFLAAPRLDNLCSTWAATEALRAAAAAGSPRAVLATLFDHEEVGSGSRTGAQGPHLRQVLERLVQQRGGDRQDLFAALASSACASADMAHAVHPNYADKHDPGHQVQLNGGPVIKVNQNQRYATEGETQALFELAVIDVLRQWPGNPGLFSQVEILSDGDMRDAAALGNLTIGQMVVEFESQDFLELSHG